MRNYARKYCFVFSKLKLKILKILLKHKDCFYSKLLIQKDTRIYHYGPSGRTGGGRLSVKPRKNSINSGCDARGPLDWECPIGGVDIGIEIWPTDQLDSGASLSWLRNMSWIVLNSGCESAIALSLHWTSQLRWVSDENRCCRGVKSLRPVSSTFKMVSQLACSYLRVLPKRSVQ